MVAVSDETTNSEHERQHRVGAALEVVPLIRATRAEAEPEATVVEPEANSTNDTSSNVPACAIVGIFVNTVAIAAPEPVPEPYSRQRRSRLAALSGY